MFCLNNSSLSGPINLTGPEAVTQSQFAKSLADALHRPCVFHTPAWLLRSVAGEMADELLLASLRATPERLIENGFEFKYKTLKESLSHWI